MDHAVLFAATGWDDSLIISQNYALQGNQSRPLKIAEPNQGNAHLQRLHDLAAFARSGYLQFSILVVSLLFVVQHLLRRPYTRITRPETNASSISLPYEICSQVLRAAVLALAVVASVGVGDDGSGRWGDVTAFAYAFVLGLLRLINDLEWRHVALHHVNLVLVVMLFVVAVGDVLPYADVGYDRVLDPVAIASISTLAAAVTVAFHTPREWVPPSLDLDLSEKIPTREPALEETCSYSQYYLTFGWLTSLVFRGWNKQLVIDDLPRLPGYDEPLVLLARIASARNRSRSSFGTVLRFMWVELATMSVYGALAFSLEVAVPFAMYRLLGYISNSEDAQVRPWIWLVILFLGCVLRSVAFQQYVFVGTRAWVRVKSALTQELYHKAMVSMEINDEVFAEIAATGDSKKKTDLQKKTTATGRLANLISSDVDAICMSRDVVMLLFGVSFGTVLSMVGLYGLMGWPAVVGIVFLFVLTPLPLLISKGMVGVQRELRKIQDSRLSVVSEYLSSIKVIKYFAWEDAIVDNVKEIRAHEQKQIWSLDILSIALGVVTEAIPTLALLLIFILHVLVRKQPLTADLAFTAIALVRNLRRNLSLTSTFSRTITAALISFKRLDRFFYHTTALRPHPEGPLNMKNASFRRHETATFTLDSINLNFVEGGLNVVTGASGSGKSTLLMAILGETLLESGTVTCPKDIAYASQSPWLQNETIRENILFNSEFEQARYDRIIEACGLAIDMNEFPDRDQTEVGENGTSLSGGQKSRVALARALYSKAHVLLLDDIFSALDAKTSASLWKEAFCGDLLKGRTVVLVTQLPWIAPQADLVIKMENGSVKDSQQNIGISRHVVSIDEVLVDESNVDTTVEVAAATTAATDANDATQNGGKPNGLGNGSAEIAAQRRDEVTQEALKTGNTARLQFLSYMSLFGGPWYAVLALCVTTLSQVSYIGGSLWLAVWVDASDRDEAYQVGFYLGIYAAITLSDNILTGLDYLAYENGGWYAARKLHNTFIKAVMSVPLSWYKTTPVGRIVNRFASDMNSIDSRLAGMVRIMIVFGILICFQGIAVSSVLPVFIIPVAMCCVLGILFGEMYTRTATATKRLVSASQSPLLAQFADSLAGLAVIRARTGLPETFGHQLADKLRTMERSLEAQVNCNRWVAVRIDIMTGLVTLAAGAIAVSKAGTVAAGLVGFSLSNATTLNSLIVFFVRSMNDVEVELQGYHRVKEYANVKPEEDVDDYKDRGAYTDDPLAVLPKNWPTSGEIEFRNVTIKYDTDGPEILKNINLKFKAGERVAVVGRTGSGKSTLVLSLLRFTNIVSGQIFFDGIDITSFPRRILREALTIIPQEPVLFTGDVGSNLDPTGKVPRETLEKALEYCRGIASFDVHRDSDSPSTSGDSTPTQASSNGVAAQGISLSSTVKAKGENFSHGQRQVLSLCRALVRKSKLMLLDEATASMDYETDQGIQEVLRKELNEHGRDRTLVTIAHRLKTIIDYDRVVVLSAGSVLEVGSPKELFDAKGQFYEMMLHSGEFEDLQKILGEKS